MVARVQLIKKDNSYCVLTYPNSDEDPQMRTYFPYLNGDKEKILKEARDFGNSRAKSFNTKLEENL